MSSRLRLGIAASARSSMLLVGLAGVIATSIACSGSSAPTPGAGGGTASDIATPAKGPAILPGSVTKPGEPPVGLAADQCNATTDGGPVTDGWLTAEIHCGDTIKGFTRGGVQKFDTKFYEKNFCTPATTNHDGGEERLYKLAVEDQTRAIVYLDSPCTNLDVAAFRGTGGDKFPTIDQAADQCEMDVKNKKGRKMLDLRVNTATDWWIVVEGQKDESEGAFALTVQCEKW